MEYPLYIFLHQHKTAGKTLLANLSLNIPEKARVRLNVGPAGLDISKRQGNVANPGWVREPVDAYVRKMATPQTLLVEGHFAYLGVHELVPTSRPARYVTFMRHPVERVVSLYNYLRYNSPNYWHEELVNSNWSLEEWLEKSEAMWARNGQVRHVLFPMFEHEVQERELSPALLAEAKSRLNRFWFVGFTESFRQDSFYLYGKMRLARFSSEEVVNATTRKEPVSPSVYKLIQEYNSLDMELYDYACHLRRLFFARHWLNYQWNIKYAEYRRDRFQRNQRKQTLRTDPD